MTWCLTQFQRFDESIRLNQGRWERIDQAVSRLVEFCDSDDELRAAKNDDLFFQGSVRTRTVIKPIADDDFDVDLVYPFDLARFSSGATPSGIMEWFCGRLMADGVYRERLERKPRCARINYAGDFHLDVTPATQSVPQHQPYAVPAKDLGTWITTDPIGFADWIAALDARAGGGVPSPGRFVRSVRAMKRWRDTFFDGSSAPSSILLATMLGKHDPSHQNYSPPLDSPLYPAYQNDISYLYDMLRLTHSCLTLARESSLMHPTIKGENLSQGWAEKHLDGFLRRLGATINHMRMAIESDSDATSIQHYRTAFGDTFPRQ